MLRSLALAFLILALSCPLTPAHAVMPSDPFALRLLAALEFIDYPDVLVALAVNNTKPWERFDEGDFARGKKTRLLDRWIKGSSEALPSENLIDQLVLIHRMFDESAVDFRDLPIDDAGGDIGRDGGLESFVPRAGFPRTAQERLFLNGLRANPGFFDEVSPDQLGVLKSNRMLKVESHPVAAVEAALGRPVLDPSGTPVDSTHFLVRYQYPNAKRWREFEDLLSAGLKAQLAAAESRGLLNYDPFRPEQTVQPEFRRLNPMLLNELARRIVDPRDTGPTFFKNYQRLIAVHPFQDFNGRSLRALYRRHAGRPMFLVNFNHDLYTDEKTFGEQLRFGDSGFDLLIRAMVREENAHRRRLATNPGDLPRFFDLPEWWWFFAGSEDGATLIRMAMRDLGFNARLVAESKRWISQVPVAVRIDKKLFDSVVRDYRANLREARLLPQNPLKPLTRLPNPHVPASQIPAIRRQ